MLPLNPKALFALSSLVLGGALLVSGCGGGGGGVTTPTATPTGGPTATPTTPGVVFADEFNSGSLDGGKWSTLDNSHVIQRTRFGNKATFGEENGTKFMRVNLDTFLPNNSDPSSKVQFYGTEIAGKTLIPRGTGIRFEARMRMETPSRTGMVGSFFAFGQKGEYGGDPKLSFDELDHELLTKAFAATPPYTWTNCFNDFRVPQPGLENGDSYADTDKNLGSPQTYSPGYDSAAWNVYRIDWKPGQVQWFINDNLIRTDSSETTKRVPDDPLAVRFNLWSASTDWVDASDPSFTPAATAAENKTYSLDVDWVRVRGLDSTTTNAVRSTPTTRSQVLSDAQIARGLSGPGHGSSKKR